MSDGWQNRSLRAPGKMFWIGEYAVLFGGDALVAAVDRYALADLRLKPAVEGDKLLINSTHTSEPLTIPCKHEVVPLGGDWALVESVIRTLRDELPGFEIPQGILSLNSDDLQSDSKLGLGSSGAIAVLTTAALTALDPLTFDDLERIALQSHHLFQGRTGSGGDVIASARGGLTLLAADNRRPVEAPTALSYGALFTGVSANTRTLVSRVKDAAGRDAHVRTLLDRLADISSEAIQSLMSGDIRRWMTQVREFHDAECQLSYAAEVEIVTNEVQACVDLANRFGCAAKASGAGGGDVVVVFTDDSDALSQLRAESTRSGFAFIDLRLDHDGLNPVVLGESLP